MEATFGEPYLLSSYAQSSKSASLLPHVFGSPCPLKNKSEGYIGVAVQGDGVHVLDLATQHALVSHSTGPSTTFACPPLLKKTGEDSSDSYSIYALIEGSPEIKPEASSLTVWVWDEDGSSETSGRTAQKKRSIQVPHRIARITSVDELDLVLLFSSEGTLTITSHDLNVLSTTPGPSNRKLKESFAFSRKDTKFAPSRTAPLEGAIVVFVEEDNKSTWLRACGVAPDATVVPLGDISLPIHPKALADISCDPSGFLTSLTHQSIWHSFKLTGSDGTTIELITTNDPLHLALLGHTKSDDRRAEVSLLSLGSSHVLLAGSMSSGNNDIALLTWDMQYSVLLASHIFPRPSSFTKDTVLRINLIQASSNQAVLVISPANQKDQAKSSIIGIPYTVPLESSIANAMGRGASGAQWLVSPDPSQGEPVIDYEPGQKRLLNVMKDALVGKRTKVANDAFFEWERKDSARRQAAAKRDQDSDIPTRSSYGYEFVHSILKMWFPVQGQVDPAYLPEVAHHLLQTRSISAGMAPASQLLGFYTSRGDWKSVRLALECVLDLTEADIVATLRLVILRHLNKKDEMPVDSSSDGDAPELEEFLALVVSYAYTPSVLKVAIRQQLRDARESLCMLNILQKWLQHEPENHEIPNLKQTADFICTLLDSSFLSLVQYSPAHDLLKGLSAALKPELELSQNLERLRVPLEPFARTARDRMMGKKTGDGLTRKERKIREQAQNAVVIGSYRLEELSL